MRAPSRMVQVVSMRPSGVMFQRPFSRVGTAFARTGRRTRPSSTTLSPGFTSGQRNGLPIVMWWARSISRGKARVIRLAPAERYVAPAAGSVGPPGLQLEVATRAIPRTASPIRPMISSRGRSSPSPTVRRVRFALTTYVVHPRSSARIAGRGKLSC